MVQKEEKIEIPFRSIFSGAFMVVLILLLFTIFLGVLTEIGWTGIIKWSGSMYLIVVYLSIIIGSVMAGLNSNRQGWITGIGVGFMSSIIILLLAYVAGENINWPIYLVKTIINSFIGIFGGIVGVNFANND